LPVTGGPRSAKTVRVWPILVKGRKMMPKARIYRPAKTAMQSGTARTKSWTLEYEREGGKSIDPLMGWTGAADMTGQIRLSFDSQEDAEAYAKRMGLDAEVKTPQSRRRIIKAYADNFK